MTYLFFTNFVYSTTYYTMKIYSTKNKGHAFVESSVTGTNACPLISAEHTHEYSFHHGYLLDLYYSIYFKNYRFYEFILIYLFKA